MKPSSSQLAKPDNVVGKSKSTHEVSDHAPDRSREQAPYKKHALSILPPNPIQNYRSIEHFTPLKLPINEVFKIIKNQPWVSAQS